MSKQQDEIKTILIINGGSSSIKFVLYGLNAASAGLSPLLSGELEKLGAEGTQVHFRLGEEPMTQTIPVTTTDIAQSIAFFVNWLTQRDKPGSICAIGHRVVHGMNHTNPEIINEALLDELKKISAFDPDHLPEEIKLIELIGPHFPGIPQVACFDTSFHTSMPDIAKLLAVPRRLSVAGLKRYGFHGLSYSYLLEELNAEGGSAAANGRVIFAHLGNGASLAAVSQGKCLDTSMGFTPSSGIPMGSRPGDLDPGIASYLLQALHYTPQQYSDLINHESGLLGISESSADMRDLLELENKDFRAAQAIDYFCYQVKKWIGSFSAVLGGLDTLVFSAGIGENAPEVRSRICRGMEFLGISLNEESNSTNESIISPRDARVTVRVIKTREELMLARLVCGLLKLV